MKWTLCLFFVASVATAMPQNKKGKAFSLFSVVTFPNVECTTTMTPAMKGTCVTQEECQNTGNTVATASGNCASGFGVCCFRRITEPGAVTESLSHIQSEGFPTPVAALATAPVTQLNRAFPIMTDSSVCAVKFDFINVQLKDPTAAANGGVNAGTCEDTLTVVTPARNPAAGFVPGALCGVLTGQHVYVDVNTAGGAMAATININNDNTPFNRVWKILVQRIACNSPDLPPAGCLQFFTGMSGLITSFNGARMNNAQQMIENQQYRVCIKRGAGMCSVTYREADAAGQIDSFALGKDDGTNAGSYDATGKTGIGAACTAADHTFITVQPIGKICGPVLSPAADQVKTGPVASNEFGLTVTAADGVDTAGATGFNLIYNQVACN